MAKRLKGHYDCVYGHFILTGGLAAAAVGRELKIPSFIAYGECDYISENYDSTGVYLYYYFDGGNELSLTVNYEYGVTAMNYYCWSWDD